jgi:hypothetical protein
VTQPVGATREPRWAESPCVPLIDDPEPDLRACLDIWDSPDEQTPTLLHSGCVAHLDAQHVAAGELEVELNEYALSGWRHASVFFVARVVDH